MNGQPYRPTVIETPEQLRLHALENVVENVVEIQRGMIGAYERRVQMLAAHLDRMRTFATCALITAVCAVVVLSVELYTLGAR